jgi:hypothetical protein
VDVFDVPHVVDALRRTPAALRALLGGASGTWVHANEGPETFSAFDNVGHLIDGEETDWIPRARIILAGGGPFPPFDRLRHRSRNAGRTMDSLVDEFERLHRANVDLLRSWQLTEAQLAMTGEHATFGSVTLRQLLATWMVHDLGHIAQISRVLAKQHRDDVGPWVEFLPVLTDRPVPKT